MYAVLPRQCEEQLQVRGRLTVIFLPPSDGTATDKKVEYEAKDEPQRVLSCCVSGALLASSTGLLTRLTSIGRRDIAGGVEEDGHVDESQQRVREAAICEPNEDSDDGTDPEELHQACVCLTPFELLNQHRGGGGNLVGRTHHALRTDGTPYERRLIHHFGTCASEPA